MGKLNVGVVGCGGIAQKTILPQAAKIGEFKLTGFADLVEGKAREACDLFSGEYATTEVSRLLEDDRIDAVLICTLPDTHASLAAQFLDVDKHVFIQKPVAVAYDQCRRLVEAEKRSKAKAMSAYCYRLSPLVDRIRESIPEPRLIFAHMMGRDLMVSHRHYLEIDGLGHGGPMLELACHNVDLVYFLAQSAPVRVVASGGNMHHPDVDLIDNFAMTVEFRNGCVATLLSGDCGVQSFAHKWYTEVHAGGVSAVNEGFTRLIIRKDDQEDVSEYDYELGIGLALDMQVFRDVLLERRPSPATAREGVVASLVMLKAYDSLRSGNFETLDLTESD